MMELLNALPLPFKLVIGLGLGIAAVYVLALLMGWTDSGESDKLGEEHHNLSLVEDAGELQLLDIARQYPFGSKEQTAIMDQYNRLNKQNEKRQADRRQEIVNAKMQGR